MSNSVDIVDESESSVDPNNPDDHGVNNESEVIEIRDDITDHTDDDDDDDDDHNDNTKGIIIGINNVSDGGVAANAAMMEEPADSPTTSPPTASGSSATIGEGGQHQRQHGRQLAAIATTSRNSIAENHRTVNARNGTDAAVSVVVAPANNISSVADAAAGAANVVAAAADADIDRVDDVVSAAVMVDIPSAVATMMANESNEYQTRSLVNNIYLSAEQGYAITLFKLLEKLVDDETRNKIVHQFKNECDGQALTPLVVASRNGHDKVVQILVTHFKVNLEQECRTKFDGHVVEGATALWCAAGAGHLNTVKLLVHHGANVNHKTKTLSTPLRAACFDGRLDIVSYLVAHGADVNVTNAYNNTCLMISAYKGHIDVLAFLLAHNADPNEQAHCGATALHYAAECGYTEICRLLLDNGALIKKNEHGMTAIITAAERTRELVVEMFYTRPGLMTKDEKIDALELIGASFANDKDNYSLNKSFHYLMLAMEFRYEDPDNVVRKQCLLPPVPAYENWIESQTVQDLLAIRYNNNSIQMESLTIRERILTRKCPDVAHPVVYRGAVCADNGRFDRCEALWLHALELRQLNKLSVQRDLLRFAQVFSQMIHVGATTLQLPNVLTVLHACIGELRINQHKFDAPGPKDDLKVVSEEYEDNIITALYLCTIIAKLLQKSTDGGNRATSTAAVDDFHNANPNNGSDNNNYSNIGNNLPKSERLATYKLVYELTEMRLRMRNGYSLLHLAVDGATPVDDFHISDVCRFPCPDTIRLLLMCGAHVNVFDTKRNSPLHVLTSTLHRDRQPTPQSVEVAEKITNIFIQAGIHLDAVNNDGRTAAEMWPTSLATVPVYSLIRLHESRETSLRCLASRCIGRHKIAYRDLVPKHLELYVQLHSVEKI